jgi:hypothetical protein
VRPWLQASLAAMLAAAGVVLLLLALDVDRRQAALTAGDARFRTQPGARLWQASELVPFGAATGLLGVSDDLAYRRALQALRLGQPHQLAFGSPTLIGLRADAGRRLARIARGDPDRSRRSAAENFLGALSLATSAEDEDSQVTDIEDAIESFRAAVADDETNADAKHNLELALSRLEAVQASSLPESKIGNASSGRGAGVGRAGTGY